MSDLPFIDERTREVAAPAERTWEALIAPGGTGRGAEPIARALGCDPATRSGDPGAVGSTTPGFRVARSIPPRELALEGQHHFSRYALTFLIEEAGAGRSRLRARTHAEFPGVSGTIYRAMVIGTRGHVLATRRMLDGIAARAERAG